MSEVLEYVGPEGWGDTAYPEDAGIDIPIVTQQVLEPGEFYDLPSGIKVAIPSGYYGRVAARSGALRNRRIRVYEGVIDAGFRGELFTFVEAVGPTATAVNPGDRLAQLIIQPVVHFPTKRVDILPPSERGIKGFGSSDHKSISATLDEAIHAADTALGVEHETRVYFGGPIDYQDTAKRDTMLDRWRHRFTLTDWYDPLTECAGIADPTAVLAKNRAALLAADIVVFYFPDPPNYGLGSPIELAQAWSEDKPVVVYHAGEKVGVFLRWYWQQGVMVADSLAEFERVFGEELAKVSDA